MCTLEEQIPNVPPEFVWLVRNQNDPNWNLYDLEIAKDGTLLEVIEGALDEATAKELADLGSVAKCIDREILFTERLPWQHALWEADKIHAGLVTITNHYD